MIKILFFNYLNVIRVNLHINIIYNFFLNVSSKHFV